MTPHAERTREDTRPAAATPLTPEAFDALVSGQVPVAAAYGRAPGLCLSMTELYVIGDQHLLLTTCSEVVGGENVISHARFAPSPPEVAAFLARAHAEALCEAQLLEGDLFGADLFGADLFGADLFAPDAGA